MPFFLQLGTSVAVLSRPLPHVKRRAPKANTVRHDVDAPRVFVFVLFFEEIDPDSAEEEPVPARGEDRDFDTSQIEM